MSITTTLRQVYELSPAEKYEWVLPEDATAFRSSLRGEIAPMGNSWKPLPVYFLRKDGRSRFEKYSDLPWLSSSYLVLRPGLVKSMHALLSQWGELLPLQCAEGELTLFHATTVLDIVDYEASKVVYSSVSGAVVIIGELVVKTDALPEIGIFKVKGWETGPLYLTESMVQAFKDAGCKGAQFEALWGSDTGPYVDLSLRGGSPVRILLR